jgi:hypothetical protein
MSGDITNREVTVITDKQRIIDIIKSQNFKDLFSQGINYHLNYLKDQKEKEENFKELNNLILNSFSGLAVRRLKTDEDWIQLSLCYPKDLDNSKPGQLDLDSGSKKEYSVSINKIVGLDPHKKSPEEVSESRGYRIEVHSTLFKKKISEVSIEPNEGFEISTNCTFKARKQEGKMGIGVVTKRMGTGIVRERDEGYVPDQFKVCELERGIDQLQVFK